MTYPIGQRRGHPRPPDLPVGQSRSRFESVPIGLSLRKVMLDLPLTIGAALAAGAGAVRLRPRASRRRRFPPRSSLAATDSAALRHAVEPRRAAEPARPAGLAPRPRATLGGDGAVAAAAESDLVVTSAGLAATGPRMAPQATVREWHFPSAPTRSPIRARSRDFASSLGSRPTDRVVLYSGTFEAYQGLPELIAAIPLVRQRGARKSTFVFVGAEAPAEHRAGHGGRRIIESGALRGRGPPAPERDAGLPGDGRRAGLARAYGGNLPLKIFDYLAASRPIVATDIPTHRTVLSEERGGAGRAAHRGAGRGHSRRARRTPRGPSGWPPPPASTPRPTSAGAASCAGGGRDLRRRGAACPSPEAARRTASVIIPARNEAGRIARLSRGARRRTPAGWTVEVVVVDDGSTDDTAAGRRAAGARVLELGRGTGGATRRSAGTAGALRRQRATRSSFSMPTASPRPGWLPRLLAGHVGRRGRWWAARSTCRDGLSPMARCDYYCGWYHVHSRRPGGEVPNHPPGNLSVRRADFARTAGFTEQQPVAYAHEELAWQAAVLPPGRQDRIRSAGDRVSLQPRRASAICSAATTAGATAPSRARRRPAPRARRGCTATPPCSWSGSLPLALGSAAYILGCWVRAGMLEPLLMLPAVLAARLAYSAGLVAGGIPLDALRGTAAAEARPRWE